MLDATRTNNLRRKQTRIVQRATKAKYLLFVDVEFFRPNISKTVVKPLDTVGKVSDSSIALSLQEEKIIGYLENNKRIVSKDVEKLLGIKESRTRELLKQGLLSVWVVGVGLIIYLRIKMKTKYKIPNKIYFVDVTSPDLRPKSTTKP